VAREREREREREENMKKWREYERQGTEKGRKLRVEEMEILRKLRKSCKKKSRNTQIERFKERKQVKKRMYGARCREKKKDEGILTR
jgi:hypothetical protein